MGKPTKQRSAGKKQLFPRLALRNSFTKLRDFYLVTLFICFVIVVMLLTDPFQDLFPELTEKTRRNVPVAEICLDSVPQLINRSARSERKHRLSKFLMLDQNDQLNQSVRVSNSSELTQRTCTNWTFDYAEWTLSYSNDSFTTRENYCPPPPEETKKITYANRSSVLVGCTKQTPSCKERAHFNRIRNITVNSPPCCRRHLIDIWMHFTELLKLHNVPHVLTFGGLIGWSRNKRMIAYDNDLDILVTMEFWRSDLCFKILRDLATRYGYCSTFVEDYKLKVKLSAHNSLGVDVWPMRLHSSGLLWKKKTHMSIDLHGSRSHPIENILPPRLDIFEGVEAYIPNNPIAYLDMEYGQGKWRKPLTCSSVTKEGYCKS